MLEGQVRRKRLARAASAGLGLLFGKTFSPEEYSCLGAATGNASQTDDSSAQKHEAGRFRCGLRSVCAEGDVVESGLIGAARETHGLGNAGKRNANAIPVTEGTGWVAGAVV